MASSQITMFADGCLLRLRGYSVHLPSTSERSEHILTVCCMLHADAKLLKRIPVQTKIAIGFEIHDWVCDGVRDDCPMEWGVHVELPKISFFLTFRVCCSAWLLHAVTRAAASVLTTHWALCSLYVTSSHSLFVTAAFSLFTSVFACKHVLAWGTKRRSAWRALLCGKKNAGQGVSGQ